MSYTIESIQELAQKMPKYPNLCAEIKRSGLSDKDLAAKLHMSPMNFRFCVEGKALRKIKSDMAYDLVMVLRNGSFCDGSFTYLFSCPKLIVKNQTTCEAIMQLISLFAESSFTEENASRALEKYSESIKRDALNFISALVNSVDMKYLPFSKAI